MPGETKLTIVWDGLVPGLADHRLSLAAFAQSLKELVFTIRRIASDLDRDFDRDAIGRPSFGGGVGRNTKEASLLDVQIAALSGSSPVTLECTVVPMTQPPYPLLANLGDRAVERFLSDIEMEANGKPTHFKVRQFMRSLPAGLALQKYTAALESGEKRTIEIGAVRLVEEPRALPHLIRFEGAVSAVAFEEMYIRFRAQEGDAVTCAASAQQIDDAVNLRDATVSVLAVNSGEGRMRLLRIVRISGEPAMASAARRLEQIIADWDPLLAILAK